MKVVKNIQWNKMSKVNSFPHHALRKGVNSDLSLPGKGLKIHGSEEMAFYKSFDVRKRFQNDQIDSSKYSEG